MRNVLLLVGVAGVKREKLCKGGVRSICDMEGMFWLLASECRWSNVAWNRHKSAHDQRRSQAGVCLAALPAPAVFGQTLVAQVLSGNKSLFSDASARGSSVVKAGVFLYAGRFVLVCLPGASVAACTAGFPSVGTCSHRSLCGERARFELVGRHDPLRVCSLSGVHQRQRVRAGVGVYPGIP